MLKIIKVLSFIMLITLCSAQPGTLGIFSGFVKPNVYEIILSANQKIEATVVMKQLAFGMNYDLDILLYKKGVNLYSDDNAVSKIVGPGIQPLIYTVTEGGIYYLEVREFGYSIDFYGI